MTNIDKYYKKFRQMPTAEDLENFKELYSDVLNNSNYNDQLDVLKVDNGSLIKKHKKTIIVGVFALTLILIIGGIISYNVPSGDHTWTKIDVPEHAETFHEETYETGLYDIRVKPGSDNPCYIHESWAGCINQYITNYNTACVGHNLTSYGNTMCESYSKMIDEMKAKDSYYSYVATLGDHKLYEAYPETTRKKVSNNDHIDAVTHEAHCYSNIYGVKWGECEE